MKMRSRREKGTKGTSYAQRVARQDRLIRLVTRARQWRMLREVKWGLTLGSRLRPTLVLPSCSHPPSHRRSDMRPPTDSVCARVHEHANEERRWHERRIGDCATWLTIGEMCDVGRADTCEASSLLSSLLLQIFPRCARRPRLFRLFPPVSLPFSSFSSRYNMLVDGEFLIRSFRSRNQVLSHNRFLITFRELPR